MAHRSIENYVRLRDGGLCVYCQSHGQVLDHVLPRCRGGKGLRSNLVLACSSCNTKKLDRLDPEFIVKALEHLRSVGESTEWFPFHVEIQSPETLRFCKVCKNPFQPSLSFRITCSRTCSDLNQRNHSKKWRRTHGEMERFTVPSV